VLGFLKFYVRHIVVAAALLGFYTIVLGFGSEFEDLVSANRPIAVFVLVAHFCLMLLYYVWTRPVRDLLSWFRANGGSKNG